MRGHSVAAVSALINIAITIMREDTEPAIGRKSAPHTLRRQSSVSPASKHNVNLASQNAAQSCYHSRRDSVRASVSSAPGHSVIYSSCSAVRLSRASIITRRSSSGSSHDARMTCGARILQHPLSKHGVCSRFLRTVDGRSRCLVIGALSAAGLQRLDGNVKQWESSVC